MVIWSILIGGFTPSEKYYSIGIIIPHAWIMDTWILGSKLVLFLTRVQDCTSLAQNRFISITSAHCTGSLSSHIVSLPCSFSCSSISLSLSPKRRTDHVALTSVAPSVSIHEQEETRGGIVRGTPGSGSIRPGGSGSPTPIVAFLFFGGGATAAGGSGGS